MRGQAMVLSALSLLLLALMVALSFNLSHALRGKTRLQQHSDALAYSMAIIEARSLNYFAVSNRAIASSYVAMNSIHASMAAASVTPEMLSAGENNFYQIAAMEAAMCAACDGSCQHCSHMRQAMRIGRRFRQEARRQSSRVQSVEAKFTKAVKSLDMMMDSLHLSQRAVFAQTSEVLSTGTAHGLGRLQKINAPKANPPNGAVGALNSAEFACAIDGMPCKVSGRPANSPKAELAKDMAERTHASRPEWVVNRGDNVPKHLHPQFLDALTHSIQGEGSSTPKSHTGTAKTVERRGRTELHQGQTSDNTGKVISADEHGHLISVWKHMLTGKSAYESRISSDAKGGEHTPRRAHSGQHDQFQGTFTRDLMSCAGKGHCFMQFRADPNPQKDFGQPPVYSYITQQLRADNRRLAPWQLNDSARVTLQSGRVGDGTLELAAGEGAGLSKALVYYHRLGDWREPPNMFNPFWRAKLHPFTPEEAEQVLERAGNGDAARLATTPELPL